MSIESIKARAEKASPAPWSLGEQFADGVVPVKSGKGEDSAGWPESIAEVGGTYNADFIAHSREDIPALLKVAEQARALIRSEEKHGTEGGYFHLALIVLRICVEELEGP
jgi:hypothetical protein